VKRTTLFFTILLAGCAGAGPYEAQTLPSTDEPKGDVAHYEARIAQLRAELDAAVPAEGAPDELGQTRGDLPINPSSKCLTAADLRDRICDLSERICALATSGSGADDVQHKCTSAMTACEDARVRVTNACGEL
jgi:hypothetical protein